METIQKATMEQVINSISSLRVLSTWVYQNIDKDIIDLKTTATDLNGQKTGKHSRTMTIKKCKNNILIVVSLENFLGLTKKSYVIDDVKQWRRLKSGVLKKLEIM